MRIRKPLKRFFFAAGRVERQNRLGHGWPALLAMLAVTCTQVTAVDFEHQIRPILTEHCLKCHGPEKQKSDFRVDQRAVMLSGGSSGYAAIIPGKPAESELIKLVRSTDPDHRMPPKGEPLTSQQIGLLEQWIADGATWPGQMASVQEKTSDLWSLKPVTRPVIPSRPAATAIDAFVLDKLAQKNLGFNPQADPRALIRRVTILLTGLIPTPERVERFVVDSRSDGNAAYAALVDELLASPHFGERWAQHWLDAIRWAETNGSESNLYRKNAWVYRDYVVCAFNEDRPYDQFVREQLAGDQLGVGEATGFLVSGPHVPAATVGQEPAAIRQARADRTDEVMQTLGASVMGLTVSCARCHNHKFDPITIQDYYALTAVFQGVEFGGRIPELSADHPRQRRALELQSEMAQQRATLSAGAGVWEEHWGGFTELQFPASRTTAVRIDFEARAVVIDEVQMFGTGEPQKNLALATMGTTLVSDDAMTELRGDLRHANDGEFGTQAWRARARNQGAGKPWVEIRFATAQEVSRFRFSKNREYYFETDYLTEKIGRDFPGYRISARQADGSWQEIASTATARKALARNPALKHASERLHQVIETLKEDGPRHSFIGRFIEPEATRVLRRGNPETPGEEIAPAGFAVLGGDLGLTSAVPEGERRLRFAEWLTRPEQPLTARVMVNRVWHHLLGTGIVSTAADFGFAGAPPTHPDLLDHLAAEFSQPSTDGVKPWSIKHLIRTVVLSDTFRQASAPRADGLAADAGAQLLWRYPPRRVEAEVIRDAILQASGCLDHTLGGQSYRIHNEKQTYAQWQVVDNHGPHTWRRMLYQERMRRVDDQMFTAFDFPDCGQVRAKRPVSTTPLQALNLMNSTFVVTQAALLAKRAEQDIPSPDVAGQVRRCFDLLLNRKPTDSELSEAVRIATTAGLAVVCRALINANEFAFLP